jgi:hypothetical protein
VITFARYFRPSAIATIGALSVQDINAPPPAPRGPRIAFRVKRSLMAEPDECEISIFNLDPAREKLMSSAFGELGRGPVMLQAGYGEAVSSIIFRGDSRTMSAHERHGADYAFVVTADDAGDWMSDLTFSIAISSVAPQPVMTLIAALCQVVTNGYPLAVPPIAPYVLSPHPSVQLAVNALAIPPVWSGVHNGKVVDLIDELARLCHSRWWVADGLLYFATRGLPTDGLAVVLPRGMWLQEPTDAGKGFVQHKTLFDPNIMPGRMVTIVGDPLRDAKKGITSSPELLRCEVAEHRGDTRSGPWSTTMTLRRGTSVVG